MYLINFTNFTIRLINSLTVISIHFIIVRVVTNFNMIVH